jgi:exosortase
LIAVLTWTYAPVLAALAAQWRSDENYSHGFLVVPFAAYVAWQRRRALLAAEPAPSTFGLLIVLASAIFFVAGQFGAELLLTRISLIGMLAGTVAFVWGGAHLRILAFPLLFLLFMIPLPALVMNQITMPLQFVASSVGETLIRTAGIPVLRDGNVLQLPSGSLEVVEACSGIRSLVSLIMIAVLIGYGRNTGRGAMLLGALSAVPVAIITNAARVAGTGLASSWIGPAAADGFFHTFTGLLMFGTALVILLGVSPIIARAAAVRPAWLRRPA